MKRQLINLGFPNQSTVSSALAALALIISSAIAWAENPLLIETAKHQDAEAVRLLLSEGADPETHVSPTARQHCIGQSIKKTSIC